MAEIVLDDVWKVYPDGTEAVRSLDLDIADKEFMVLVGPSGCGKTTALRMVAGLEVISRGDDLDRRARRERSCRRRNATSRWCSRTTRCTRTCRVFDNMAFGLKLQRMPKQQIAARVNDAARILGLARFA